MYRYKLAIHSIHICYTEWPCTRLGIDVAWRRKAEMPAWHSKIFLGCATISCCRPLNPGEKCASFEIARKCLDEIWNQEFTQLNPLPAKMARRGFQISPGYARDTPVTHPWHSRDTSGFFRDTPGSQDFSPGPEFLSRINIYSFLLKTQICVFRILSACFFMISMFRNLSGQDMVLGQPVRVRLLAFRDP